MWDLEPVASLELDNLLQRQFPVLERPLDLFRWALGPRSLHVGPQCPFGGPLHRLIYLFVVIFLPLILGGAQRHEIVLSS